MSVILRSIAWEMCRLQNHQWKLKIWRAVHIFRYLILVILNLGYF